MSRIRNQKESEMFIDELNYSLYMIKAYKIDVIKDYLTDFDKYLKEKTTEIQDKIFEWENSEKEHKYSGVEYYIDEYTNYNSNFKKLKLESTFLSSYSLFEHYLKSFIEIYTKYYEMKVVIDDLNGNNYINKSKQYLEKVIDINLEKMNSTWREITKYQRIRNKIVHNNGKLNSSETETIKELSKMKGIEISKLGWITLTDKEFILDFWELFDEYINGIIAITIEKIKILSNKV
ncbi:hypothetical protein [Flavobacterium frigoris]|uniref:Cthe-2314-like HEPN domain-containing protein n=1 Tax=Flavobacterium frigoris TaxID=229204 RepID=A0A1H9KRK3_FLAFI|nr:hypothetical protein [Flavobacterium frigoris]SER01567.1 hypothetical protein SAMN05444355_10671 [Flavobacterium frigoris]